MFWFLYEAAKKAELSTELQEKDSTIGGIAAAAASDHEYREEGMYGYFS